MNQKLRRALWRISLVAFLLPPAAVRAQDNAWGRLNDRGIDAAERGDYAEAEKALSAALKLVDKRGRFDPRLPRTLTNLGAVYNEQGRHDEAVALYKRALTLWEGARRADPVEMCRTLNNLAWVYSTQAKDAEAESMFQRGIGLCEKALGPGHPDVALTLNGLANLYLKLERFEQAEPLYRRALAAFEKTVGGAHPNSITTMENYAELLRRTGREGEAKALEARAARARQQ
jgi:tetratricopeptide (TPR) repeat protein